MASPTIVINNGGTGSDTQASGAGPATAVFGTNAATHTNTTVNITDAVALGGVATDGSAVLWVATSSGRQWSPITAISGSSGAWVVTVGNAYATTQSGATWAIGGKRATLASSAQLGSDYLGGWTIDLQQTGTDYTLTAEYVLAVNAAGPGALLTSTSATRPILSTATNSLNGLLNVSNCQHLTISHLNLKYTGSGGSVRAILPRTANGSYITLVDCILDGWYIGWDGQNSTYNGMLNSAIVLCEVKNCTNAGVYNQAPIVIDRCYIHGCTLAGAIISGANNPASIVTGCVIDSNGSSGAGACNLSLLPGNGGAVVSGSTISNSPIGPGILTSGTGGTLVLVNSIVYGNATYGVDNGVSAGNLVVEIDCGYGANATAARRGFSAGSGAVTLTASPFVSGTDFGLNATAGGGAACKAAGLNPPNVTAKPAPDLGAVPSGGGASVGGGLLQHPGMTGNIKG